MAEEIAGGQPETEETPNKGRDRALFDFKNEAEGYASTINHYATSLQMIFANMEQDDFDNLDRMEAVWYLAQQIDWVRQDLDVLMQHRVTPLREAAGIFAHPSVREARNGQA